MSEKPECFGKFKRGVVVVADSETLEKEFSPCLTCPENIACFMSEKSCVEKKNKLTQISESECPLLNKNMLECQPMKNFSTAEQNLFKTTVCQKIHLYNKIRTMLPCFAEPTSYKKKCVACDKFSLCEIYEIIIKNLSLSEDDVRIELSKQMRDIKRDSTCFGKYAPDLEECAVSCDWNVHCLKEAGMFPGKCKFFSEFKNTESLAEFEKCSHCIAKNECVKLILKERETTETSLRMKNIMKVFKENNSVDIVTVRKIFAEPIVGQEQQVNIK